MDEDSQMRTRFMNILAGGAALILAATPALAGAQERTLFTWSGRADQSVDVTIRGSSVSESNQRASQARGNGRQGRSANGGSVSLRSALPRQDGYVRVATSGNQGAAVLQQPSSSNGYTAIIRLGNGNGRGNGGQVTAYWSPAGNGGTPNVANDRNGRSARAHREHGDRDREDRDRDDRDRDDGDHDDHDRRDSVSGGHSSNGGYNDNGGDDRAGALHWYGDVDGITQLTLRGAQLTISNIAGSGSRNVGGNDAGIALPSRPVTVSIVTREGRGRIGVVQQPTAANGYTTIIRIVDAPSGYGHYDFDVTWR